MAAACPSMCLLCGTITANKDRRVLDLTQPNWFNECIKWLYQVKLVEKGKTLASSVFCDKAHFCRKCFKSFQTFSEKASTFLNGAESRQRMATFCFSFSASNPSLTITSFNIISSPLLAAIFAALSYERHITIYNLIGTREFMRQGQVYVKYATRPFLPRWVWPARLITLLLTNLIVVSTDPVTMTLSSNCKHRTEPV